MKEKVPRAPGFVDWQLLIFFPNSNGDTSLGGY